jgi:hypothetical protein
MGIDAAIMVRRVPNTLVNEEWLKEMSWRLCESIGAKHLLVSDGLPPEEHRRASQARGAAFKAHPLYTEWQATDRINRDNPGNHEASKRRFQIAKQIFDDIGGDPPKRRSLAIERTAENYREESDPEPGSVYRYHGDDIVADQGECLLVVHVLSRYYGVGYTRGDIIIICAIAEWLEANISGCEVWYGGDDWTEPFPDAKRRELRNHLYSANGRDYYNRWKNETRCKPAACSLCPGGKYRGSQYGSGHRGLYAAFHCPGCGKSVKTSDGGCTWAEE